eukprot:TRINITY_DN26928_c2_g1_i1.p1 TRINITY_DN26928_c2_g1~~TRINITY_DN26928_c2_g1_i1.p1  ORF type:complete len:108 (+),score=8.67 TRINITY_DN26928_c2_g1_i1:123-446(+)
MTSLNPGCSIKLLKSPPSSVSSTNSFQNSRAPLDGSDHQIVLFLYMAQSISYGSKFFLASVNLLQNHTFISTVQHIHTIHDILPQCYHPSLIFLPFLFFGTRLQDSL